MDIEEDYLIHELAEKVGVSVRTIRYYISEGLLPSPDNKGRYATFNEEYRQRLELIRRLKDAFLPLKEIRDRIVGLDPAQVQQMLDQLEAGASEAPTAGTSSQEVFISQDVNSIRERPLNDALNYLAQVMGAQETGRQRPRPEQKIIPPPQAIQRPQRPTQEIETWQRIVLAPGLELHVRPAEEPFYRERLRQIIEFVKIQFS